MPASLISATICGLRSYSPSEDKAQTINFAPLTLIVGANGSGKTTIIEALKFIISGDEPPSSDARRNFINTTEKLANFRASVELHFHNFKGEKCHAKREIIRGPMSAPPSISSSYRIDGRSWANIHKQDDWCRLMPNLFNLPNHAILNYVILCHQEENLWCMGDSNSVKLIFDKIFGCERYKKEIRHIQDEIKACKTAILIGEKELLLSKDRLVRRNQLISQVDDLSSEIKKARMDIEALDIQISEIETDKKSLISDIKKANADNDELVSLNKKAADILETFEQDLLQNKCDQSELEDNISSEMQKISGSSHETQGKYKSLLQKLEMKESIVRKLLGQRARADPMSKDLSRLKDLISQMSPFKSAKLPALDILVEEALSIIEKLVSQYGKDNLKQISDELDSERDDIQQIKTQLNLIKDQEKELSEQKSLVEARYSKVRSASKEAHNRIMYFKNARIKLSRKNDFAQSRSMRLRSIADDIEHLQGIIQNCKMQNQVVHGLEEVKEKLFSLKTSLEGDFHLPELESKLEKTQGDEIKLRDRRSILIGTSGQLERELGRIKTELKTHSDTMSKYAESLGKIVCHKIIRDDLESLNNCFQQSITTFHNQMIIKINEVLKSRWRQIYKGSDIEYIELIAEEIIKGKDKKAFNYYMGMRKSGNKMKMREKSSTGQKALASIILRMTLAELFVKDLAFMALDEPTANLDSANSESLAKAIGMYVRKRIKSGCNLQWIIISHSEKFLSALNSEFSPFYYKIDLDSKGRSTISEVSCQNLLLHDDENRGAQ